MAKRLTEAEKEDVLGVAIPKVICPVCCREHDYEGIIMNQTLNHSQATKVRDMHGKVVGLDDKACDECMKRREEENILFALCIRKNEVGGMVPDGRRFEIPKTEENIKRFLERDDLKKFEQEHGFIFMYLGDEEQQMFERQAAKKH